MEILDPKLKSPRPSIDRNTGEVRCGDCAEIIHPKARKCPHCNLEIFTLRGRVIRRSAIAFGIIAILGSIMGSTGVLTLFLGLAFVAIGVYYYLKRPIYSIRPPHHPEHVTDEESTQRYRTP